MSLSNRERAFGLAGLRVEQIAFEEGLVLVKANPIAASAACPLCGKRSSQVRSRYQRCLADLPAHGRRVRIFVAARRFRCRDHECRREIFAERLVSDAARAWGRRTMRLDGIIHHIGLALGGRPGQAIARRLLLPVSKDTLLRTVRRRVPVSPSPPRVIGVDDWAWRKGHRYGTLICDLEQRMVIDLLPDREPATLKRWLADHPGIEIIARDRGGGYAKAAAQACPDAEQVADRWHLMENSSAAFLMAVKRRMRSIRAAFGQAIPDQATLTAAERLQHEGWKRRKAEEDTIRALHAEAIGIKEIVRRTGRSRKLVREVVRGGHTDPFRPRASSLEPWLDRLQTEWEAGCHNGAELWRRLRAAGFPGSLRVVAEWATRRRRDDRDASPSRCPAPRGLARLLSSARDKLTRNEAIIVAIAERAVPELVTARGIVDEFQDLIRKRQTGGLAAWVERALASPVASFAKGIEADYAAVTAAITSPWSNGQTEGTICRLKSLKRQMYGRANIDLLRARLMPIAA